MQATIGAPLTTGQAAKLLGITVWQVRRVYERHLLPAPARIGQWRLISADDLPAVRAAAVSAGYIEAAEDAATEPRETTNAPDS